ncbi:MAG: SDR family oxidoreductase [Acetobacteraceae bacterium]|nr:SDR family oxidoreductase [Acetobacteraceae bacterium]
MRLHDKVAIIIGAGQNPGQTIGNGRATTLRFAQEGARILAVDRRLDSAEETARLAREAGADCVAFEADVTNEQTLKAVVHETRKRFGRIDILHYNVGVSLEGGDAPVTEITEEAFDRICRINLRGAVMSCKHVLPVMREQRAGVILMISSISAFEIHPLVAYKATKAAMIAFTQQLAIQNARYGIRANAILPGLMDTPMGVDRRVELTGQPREEIAAERAARVPLKGHHPTGWDVANAALFLASDEAIFISGAALPVDGAALVRIGEDRAN